MEETFFNKTKYKADNFVFLIYEISKKFPKEELYGITSQTRRAAISVILNIIEGFARRKGRNCKVFKNFLEISYGSLKEVNYLVYFSYKQKFISESEYKEAIKLSDELGAMIWTIIKKY